MTISGQIFGWLLALALCGMVMAVILILNHVPNGEILYGLLLCAVLWICVVAADYCACCRRCRKLAEFRAAVDISLNGLTECSHPVEQQYQELLRTLSDAKQELERQAGQREREQTEYYTMWVHQIKTPIAALKLLLEEEKDAGELRQEELSELFRIEQYAEMALGYTRLKSESTDFVFRRLKLDDVIREAVRKYAKQFIRKKISLHYEPTGQMVLTDEKWLGFVLGQLLSNALEIYAPGETSRSPWRITVCRFLTRASGSGRRICRASARWGTPATTVAPRNAPRGSGCICAAVF